MLLITFSLLASSLWPEITSKSVFIGSQSRRLQLQDVQWKLPEVVCSSTRVMAGDCDGTGDAVGLRGW